MTPALRSRAAALPPLVRGALWMTVAALLFAGAAAAVRALSATVHVFEISFARCLFGVLVMTPWLLRVGAAGVRTPRMRLYMARAVFSALAMFCWFGGLSLMPVADATAVSFTTPLFGAIAGVLFLREPSSGRMWITLALGFVGAMIMLRPGTGAFNPGALLVIGSGVLIAFSAMIMKETSRADSPDLSAFYQALLMAPICLVPALFVWTWPTAPEVGLAVAVGVFSTLAQRCVARAYVAADVSAVQPFDYTRLLWAVLLGLILFGELPDVWSGVGALVIFASSVIATRGRKRPSPPRSGGEGRDPSQRDG